MAHIVKIGTTYGALALLSTYSVSNPDLVTPAVIYSKAVSLQSGGALGVGWAACAWKWKTFSTAERTALRVVIPGASAAVFIETMDEGYAGQVYTAIARWPELKPETSHLFPFDLRFVNMVEYTP